jgi:hypothetical protein
MEITNKKCSFEEYNEIDEMLLFIVLNAKYICATNVKIFTPNYLKIIKLLQWKKI